MTKEPLSPRGQWFFERLLVLAGVMSLAPLLAALLAPELLVPVGIAYGRHLVGVDPRSGFEPDTAIYTFNDPTVLERLTYAADEFIAAIVVIAVTRLLFLVVRSLREGDPFNRQNAERLRWAGLTAGIGGMVAVTAGVWSQSQMADKVPANLPVATNWSASFTPVVIGLVLLMIAEVFRRGAVMGEELEGVV